MKLTIQDGRDSFYTFDSNRILLLTATDEEQINQVEFSTEENGEEVSWTSEVLTGSDGVKYVQVPNEFLNGDYTRLVCYYVALDSNGEYTRQKEVFRIRARQEPEDYFLTYSERVTFASIKALTEQYMNTTKGLKDKAIQSMSEYIEETAKPVLKTYGEQKVDSYVNGTVKPELDRYINTEKKPELDRYVETEKKKVLDDYTEEKKVVLDDYTENEKKTELNSHTVELKKQLDAHTVAKAGDLNEYTAGLKGVLDGYTTAKEQDISEFTEQKKQEVQGVYENDLNALTSMIIALGLSVVDGELCITYTE